MSDAFESPAVVRDSPASPDRSRVTWSMVRGSLTRPYPLAPSTAVPMLALAMLVPVYLVIAELMPGRALHAPELALDRLVPLRPAWAFVYGPLYLFLILVPLFVVRQPAQIRRTLFAYLLVWLVAFAGFLLYPTVAPRPTRVVGSGFVAWGLRFLYEADPPYNCFPSLHVAHSFVSSLTCYRVHRGLGVAGTLFAALVGISTLFTKQHYVLDVVAGGVLAGVAYLVFLRKWSGDGVPDSDRRLAPYLAAGVMGLVGLVAAGFWVAYRFGA